MLLARFSVWWLSVALLLRHSHARDDKFKCKYCNITPAYRDLMLPEEQLEGPHSIAHMLWSTQVEVVHLMKEDGGFMEADFADKLAKEAIKGWRAFQEEIIPSLNKGHPLSGQLREKHAGALNDAFYHYQKNLFEQAGNLKDALNPKKVKKGAKRGVGTPGYNSSWPDMDALPEYQKMRKIVDRLSRRYLMRAGLHPKEAKDLKYSIFNWAAINSPGEFHGPHTHIGEYHVAVFYAQVGRGAGKLRFGDPRGTNPPFGQELFISPKAGDLVLFPAWLGHMATVTGASADITRDEGTAPEDDPYRVIFSFNIGPEDGPMPCYLWWSDPTGDVGFSRKVPIDASTLGVA